MNKTNKIWLLFCFCFSLLFANYAWTDEPRAALKPSCGADVLESIFGNLGLDQHKTDRIIGELNAKAYQNKGMNSLYEIKLSAQKAGLATKALMSDLNTLSLLAKDSYLIANITGNRHFCLIKKIDKNGVSTYIPGMNYGNIIMPKEEFLSTWDKVVLLVSNKPVDLRHIKGKFENVPDSTLQNILGGDYCANISGSGGGYSGSEGDGNANRGNGSGNQSGTNNDATTADIVVIRNGNLYLDQNDISIPTVSALPLSLSRYYNSETVSEIYGWNPEPGAGSWVIENGQYSGYGDRSITDAQFSDLTLELDMQTVQPGSSYSWETAWVNFRYQPNPSDIRKALNCYYFLIHTNGMIELSKWQDGIQYFLVTQNTSINPTQKNHVKIIAQGANIQVFINGVLQINYTDSYPLLAAGSVALQSHYCHAYFDNISIVSGTDSYFYDFSSDDNEFIFGYGWMNSYSLRIKEYQNHVTLFRENNYREIYVPQGDGTYVSAPVNYYSNLTKDATGFSLKTKHKTHYRFDLSGRLQYIEDRNLNRTTLGYSTINGKLLLSSITEPTGRKITLQYGANGMVSKAIDPQGNFLQYFYDVNNELIKVIDRNGNSTTFSYDPVTYNLTALTDPMGNTYRYAYTYNDRINTQTDPLGKTTTFDYLWSTVHVTNGRGEIYKYNFDAKLFLQSVTDPYNHMERSINDANGNILNYFDKMGNQSTFTYDASGNKTSIFDPLGNRTSISYELVYNQPTSITDANGNVTTYSYDAKGNLVQVVNAEGGVITNTYNSFGKLVSTTDPNGNLTQFSYDQYGNLSAKTDAQGNTTSYTYDILGRLLTVTDALANTVTYTCDANNNLLSRRDPLGNVVYYTYTGNNKLASMKDELGNITSYSYDCFGNLIRVIDAMGNTILYTYDTANQLHLNKANLMTITDAKGNATSHSYDALDKLTNIIDSAGNSWQFTYDAEGNISSRIDANGTATNYQYDALNRLYGVLCPEVYIQYFFDPVGNMITMQERTRGIVYTYTTRYTYDRTNRLKSLVYYDGTTLNYTYDPNGNKKSLGISGFGTILYNYDTLNRLMGITDPSGKTSQFSYDNLSRRAALTYPNGASATYAYDNAGRLIQLINKAKSGQDISRFIYTYDNASRRTRVDLINGSISYSYDKLGQLLQETGTIGSQPFFGNYSYDAAGNRVSLNDNGSIANYTYNSLNQLVQSSGSKLIQVKGNVSDITPVTVKVNGIPAVVSAGQFIADNILLNPGLNMITSDAQDAAGNTNSNQISVTYTPTTSNTNFTYDRNGNLIQRTVGSNVENFQYDSENRLSVYTSGNNIVNYRYNGLGKRVYKAVNGLTTQYYYDADQIVSESTIFQNPIYNIYGPAIDEVISDSRGYSYQYDGLGSVVNLTDAAGVGANSYVYRPFGEIRLQTGSVSNQWLFTGRQFDPETNLYHYRNRSYDPRVGKFTTQDPLAFFNPRLQLQKYLYCLNNPINLTDPLGLEGRAIANNPAVLQAFENAYADQLFTGKEQGGWIVRDSSGPSSPFTSYHVERFPAGDSDSIYIPNTRPPGTVGEFHTHSPGGKLEPGPLDYRSQRMNSQIYDLNTYVVGDGGAIKYSAADNISDLGTGNYYNVVEWKN